MTIMRIILANLIFAATLNLYYRIIQGKTTFDNKSVAVKQFVIPVFILTIIMLFISMLLHYLNAAENIFISELLAFLIRLPIESTVFFLRTGL